MKKLSTLLLFAITLIVSCNNNSKKGKTAANGGDTASTLKKEIMTSAATCYTGNIKKDTVRMRVEVFENVVTGSLAYRFFEKDSNKGEFEGTIKGDTLLADYKFMSEGTQSVRQVVFLIKDSSAIEGYGDMEEKNGRMIFKNLAGVTFGKVLILKKENCNY